MAIILSEKDRWEEFAEKNIFFFILILVLDVWAVGWTTHSRLITQHTAYSCYKYIDNNFWNLNFKNTFAKCSVRYVICFYVKNLITIGF